MGKTPAAPDPRHWPVSDFLMLLFVLIGLIALIGAASL